jgi:hypothetical protein
LMPTTLRSKRMTQAASAAELYLVFTAQCLV